MILYEIPLAPALDGTEKLYFRKEKDGYFFNTFFGALSIEKIKKFTDISCLGFEVEAEDEFEAEIRTEEKALALRRFDRKGTMRIKTSEIADTAKLLYPVIRTKGKLKRLTVTAECEVLRQVNCVLITCTYRRERQVKENIRRLYGKTECTLMVVDNAGTLKAEDFPSGTVLVGNINNGGSGGYKKGMETACEMGGFTHFLLMDDDVEIDCASVQRAVNFLKCVKSEYRELSVAGSMLFTDKPTRQFEAGGNFDETGKQKGFGHFLDLTDENALIENQRLNDINYGGWWFMLMPSKYAEQGNLPLPFFMKYDDVEYALRCRQKIITLNGVGVWHEKFESKYNSAAEYYNIRNYLHLCGLYCKDFTDKKARKIAKRRIRDKQRRQQYRMAQAVKRGYEDYLKGLDYLKNLDAEQNHNEICGLNYTYLTYDEIEKRYGVRPRDNKFYPPPRIKRLIFALLPKKYAFTDAFYDRPVQYLTAKYAVHCDPDRNRGYVTGRNCSDFKKILRRDRI